MRLISGTVAIFVLALLVYLPILPGAFLMDDLRLVQTDNPLVNGQLTPLSIWFQTDFPLSNLTFLAEWLAWGQRPAFYHLFSIALHALSAVFVWRLLARLKIPGAWLAGILFAVHPVCVNSVARIAELKNTLSLPFFLMSVLCYLHYETSVLYPDKERQKNTRRTGTLFYTFSLIAFVLSLFAKTSTVMLPVILLACAVWQRGKLSRRDLVHTSPHFALALSFGLMSVWFQKYQALAGEALAPVSFMERFLIAARVFWFYLGKALMPLNLNIIYPRWKVDAHSVSAFVPIALVCVGIILCWRFRRSWGHHVMFGLGCFVILLFPALGFFDAQYLTRWQVSDHLQYLPLIAPIALVSAAIVGILKSKTYRLSVTALLLALLALTFQRARVFSTQEGLMRDTLAKNPAASDAHNDLGVILTRRNNLPEAATEFAAAAQTDPDNATAESNLGLVLVLQGNLPEAKSHFEHALKTKPFDPETHLRLASLLGTQGQSRAARVHLQTALRFKPAVNTRLQLAESFYHSGEFARAVAQFRQAILSQPDLPEALNNLAWLLATCANDQVRDGAGAVRCAERACQLTAHKQSGYLSTLAAAYAEAGRFPEAIETAEQALRLQIAAGETDLAGANRQLLIYYHAGKAFHEQPTIPGIAAR